MATGYVRWKKSYLCFAASVRCMKVWLSLSRRSGFGQWTADKARRRVSSVSRILEEREGGREREEGGKERRGREGKRGGGEREGRREGGREGGRDMQ